MSCYHADGDDTILLTGSTGFLGAYLCAELLRQTPARVACLVRATDRRAAATRLRSRLAEIGALNTATAERIWVVPGDLLSDNLGIACADYAELAATVRAIYHCASDVNLAASYADAQPVNVGGTIQTIGLATAAATTQKRPVRLHYISTLGTFSRAAESGLEFVDESTRPTPAMSATIGYTRSKTEAENLIRAACTEDILTTIHRPGVVTGDYISGRSSASDVAVALMCAMLALRIAPLGSLSMYLDTVNSVAHGIVALSLQRWAIGNTYHHVRPDPLTVTDLVAALRSAGHRIPTVPPHVWWKMVEDNADNLRVLPAAIFGNLGGPILAEKGHSTMPAVRCERTWQALRACASPHPPPLDREFLGRLIAASVSACPPASPEHLLAKGYVAQ